LKKRTAAVLLALAIFMVQPGRGGRAASSAAAAPTDPAVLWQHALDIFRKNSDLYPEKIAILSEVLDRHDQPDSITQLFFTTSMDDKGQLRTELTRALKNGKDISEEMKIKMEIHNLNQDKAAAKEESLKVSLADSPFNPDRQQDVTSRPSDEKQMLFGHICRRFDFTYRTEIVRKGEAEKLIWTGIAWLEENSGIPIKLEFSLAPLPGRIHGLWTIYLYETSPPGRWFVKEIKIAGHGGFLFIKKKFRSTTTFSAYRRQPQGGPEK